MRQSADYKLYQLISHMKKITYVEVSGNGIYCEEFQRKNAK